jgi:hypothetical protein
MRSFVAAVVGLAFCAGSLVAAEELKGKLKDVDKDSMTVTVTATDGTDHTIHVTGDSKITVDGKKMKFVDLKPGSQVTVTYEDVEGKKTASELKVKTRARAQ